MMVPSNIIIFQLSISVLLLITFTMTTNIHQATESEISQSYDDEQNSASIFPNDHHNLDNFPISSKRIGSTDDDSSSEEEYDNDDLPIYYDEAFQPQIINKRYANLVIRGGNSNGDNRLLAIPYRFGKRAVMPYRFGKRAAMPYRFGKRAAMPYRFGKRAAMPYRFGKRADMHFRLGKESASL